MAYDLLIKNGRIVDGSGMPSYRGDVAVTRGRIAELGRLTQLPLCFGQLGRIVSVSHSFCSKGFSDSENSD